MDLRMARSRICEKFALFKLVAGSPFNEALELNPSNAEAYYNRGSAYAHKDQYDRAISDYSKAIELNPRYEQAYNNWGLVYYYEGKHDEACSDWRRACELGLCKNYELAIIKGACL